MAKKPTYNKLEQQVRGLEKQVARLKAAEKDLREKNSALRAMTKELQGVNQALRVLLSQKDKDKLRFEEKVLLNVKELVFPYIETLRKKRLDPKAQTYLAIIESNLGEIISPVTDNSSSTYSNLTPTEIQIVRLLRAGRTSREIAELLESSTRTVESHRRNIRKKLGITNRKTNLTSFLLSGQE
jgi:DNA-binding CsgD family transcriptional regulator/exonuclease VII small subunit